MEEKINKITADSLRKNGYKPHRYNGNIHLYEKEGIIIQIVPFINIVNIMKEIGKLEYPIMVKRNIKTWEELEEYISNESRH